MFRLVEVKALSDYKVWLSYADGVEGEVDLSDLAGRGVFELWDDYSAFENVRIGEHGELTWGNDIDLCPNALYLRLTGKAPEEVFPNLRQVGV